MKRIIENLEFFLYVKPIKLNAGGKAFMPPCELRFPVIVDLFVYTEQFRQEEENLFEVTESVKDLLGRFHKTFDAPLGWMITAERENNPKLREDAKFFKSKEFCYSPATNQTTVDLSFFDDWLYEEVNAGEIDISDLFFSEKELSEIAQSENN